MFFSRNVIFIVFFLMVSLGISLNLVHQPASAQTAQTTPPAPATSANKFWLSFLQPSEIVDLAVAGNDIWAATEYSLIHWDRASGDYTQYTSVEGQPAGGPVWWQPDPEASREWLAAHPE